jgi:hypothetical protein
VVFGLNQAGRSTQSRRRQAKSRVLPTIAASVAATSTQEFESEIPLCWKLLNTGQISWLAVRDDFRNWLQLGLQPAKGDENWRRSECRPESGEVGISHGAREAEQLFDPERA